mgnify:CR=1 FL=1
MAARRTRIRQSPLDFVPQPLIDRGQVDLEPAVVAYGSAAVPVVV